MKDYQFKCSVVILTKNPGDIFKKVLTEVVAQDTPWPFEVLVVDSGSRDGTIEFSKHVEGVRLIQISPEQFGHGRTRNFGIANTSGEFVAMLTHDALPANRQWLQEMVSAADSSPEVAGAFGRHLPYPEASPYMKRDLKLHFDHFLQWPTVMGIEDPERYAREAGYRQVVHFFSDNNACLRRSVWEKIPYPDVDFAEDQLWAKQAVESGFKRAYADKAAVYHSHDYSVWDTLRRSFDESKALKRLFGYELCPSFAHGAYQVYACSKRDWGYLKSVDSYSYWSWLGLSTPFLHLAKQTGFYLGQRSDRLGNIVHRLLSLDNALKRQ